MRGLYVPDSVKSLNQYWTAYAWIVKIIVTAAVGYSR